VQKTYDYKKELDRISHDIEHKLKKQFEDLFAQMEQKLDKLAQLMTQHATQKAEQDVKLDNFMRQHAVQKLEQDHTNEVVTKHLDYLVENMQRILKFANNPATSHSPSSSFDDGQV